MLVLLGYMEKHTLSSERFRRSVLCGVVFGTIALTAVGCSSGKYPVDAGETVTVVDKEQSHRYVTEVGGGYPHYEDIYHLVVKQCPEPQPVEREACKDLSVKVDKNTFDKFDAGDTIVVDHDMMGSPVE